MSDAAKKHNNIIDYEKERKKMENTSRQTAEENGTTSGETTGSSQAPVPKRGSDGPGRHIIKIVAEVAVAIGAVLGIVATIYNVSAKFTIQGKDIEILQNDVSGIQNSIGEINDSIDYLTSLAKDDHEIFLDLSSKDTGEKAYKVILKDAFQPKIVTIQNEEYLAAPLWKEDEKALASDAESDILYSAEDLYNTLIITSYMEDSNEVYFYGRFNENNHWNGKCILNAYNGNKLVYIFEGVYDDGVLFSYRRVSDKGDIWLVNDRICQGEYNSGETWKYVKTDDFVKDFSAEDVKEKQILTVEKFLQSKGQELLSYYHGNTANGLYNDDSGNAYLVSYFENGELPGAEGQEVVRTLYQGCFKNGVYDDDTGNAWYITREADTTYMYYKGSFSKGNVDHIIKRDSENYIGHDYILNKLKEKGFEKYITQFWIEY